MAAIVTVSESTTAKETAGMTLEAEAEAQEINEEGILVAVGVQANPSSTGVRGLQKDQVEAEDAAVTISVNRETITRADE